MRISFYTKKIPKMTMMKKSKAQRTYFVYVYGKIGLPQQFLSLFSGYEGIFILIFRALRIRITLRIVAITTIKENVSLVKIGEIFREDPNGTNGSRYRYG
jgi:hypothetical protein